MHSHLLSCPIEIIQSISLYLQLSCLLTFSSCHGYLRQCIRCEELGHIYLKNQLHALEIDIKLQLPIQQLDSFDFLSTRDTLYLVHKSSHTPLLYTFSFGDYGIPSFKQETCVDLNACQLPHKEKITKPIRLSVKHKQNCTLCHALQPTYYEYCIDKNYRVFMKSFLDRKPIQLENGLLLIVTLENKDLPDSFWENDKLEMHSNAVEFSFKRFGLVESPRVIKRCIRFFKHQGKDIPLLPTFHYQNPYK